MRKYLVTILVLGLIQSCGEKEPPKPVFKPKPSMLKLTIKNNQLDFSWSHDERISSFQLYYKIDSEKDWKELKTFNNGKPNDFSLARTSNLDQAKYYLNACIAEGQCTKSNIASAVFARRLQGYIKSPKPGKFDTFGAIALSENAGLLAVGAEGSSSKTVRRSGVVFLYEKNKYNQWSFLTEIRGSRQEQGSLFGTVVDLCDNGNMLIVGSPLETIDTGILSANTSIVEEAGSVYVFKYKDGNWKEIQILNEEIVQPGGQFGSSIKVSNDSNWLLVGAPGEKIKKNNKTFEGAGVVYVYKKQTDGMWKFHSTLQSNEIKEKIAFGYSLSINKIGTIVAIGALNEWKESNRGSVYIFERKNNKWNMMKKLVGSDKEGYKYFGRDIELNETGNFIAIGAHGEDAPSNKKTPLTTGSVYLFSNLSGKWNFEQNIVPVNAEPGDDVGAAVAINGEGSLLVIGSPNSDKSAKRINGVIQEKRLDSAGKVLVYEKINNNWKMAAKLNPFNADVKDIFGIYVEIDSTGDTIIVSATGERGTSPLVGGNPLDNSLIGAGAVYTFSRNQRKQWEQGMPLSDESEERLEDGNKTIGSEDIMK